MRWVADEFPGWIEVDVVDASGQHHRLMDKVPVFTSDDVTAESPFPLDLTLRAEIERIDGDTARVRLLDGLTTTAGLDLLTMSVASLCWQ